MFTGVALGTYALLQPLPEVHNDTLVPLSFKTFVGEPMTIFGDNCNK